MRKNSGLGPFMAILPYPPSDQDKNPYVVIG